MLRQQFRDRLVRRALAPELSDHVFGGEQSMKPVARWRGELLDHRVETIGIK